MAQKLSIQRAHNMCLYWISIFLEIGFLDASHDFVRLQVMSTWISFDFFFFGQLYFFIYDKFWMLNELSNQPIHEPYQVAVWTWFNSDWLLGLCWYFSLAPVLFCSKDGMICLQSEIYSLVLWLSDGNVSLLLQINMWRKWDCSWVCYSSYGLLTWLLELSNNGVPPKYKYRGQGCVTGQLEIAFSWSTERNRVWLLAHSLCGFCTVTVYAIPWLVRIPLISFTCRCKLNHVTFVFIFNLCLGYGLCFFGSFLGFFHLYNCCSWSMFVTNWSRISTVFGNSNYKIEH